MIHNKLVKGTLGLLLGLTILTGCGQDKPTEFLNDTQAILTEQKADEVNPEAKPEQAQETATSTETESQPTVLGLEGVLAKKGSSVPMDVINNDKVDENSVRFSGDKFVLGGRDSLGRPIGSEGIISQETLRKSEGRPPLQEDPVGFHNAKLRVRDGKEKWIYDRSHLIAYTLMNDSRVDSLDNLVTGTRTFNRKYMVMIENDVRGLAYDGETIWYKVTPLYDGDDLVPYAVHMEAKSKDSDYEINRVMYNVEDGITIDYKAGNLSQNGEINAGIDRADTEYSGEYKTCKEWRAEGVRGITKDDPRYKASQDRDGDGIACE